jgi:hypothetical protein
MRTADFLLCATCGVYVAAVIEADGRRYATVNVNVLAAGDTLSQAAEAVTYEGETAAERASRRRARWTPVEAIASDEG